MASLQRLDLDPNGDIELILEHPNAQKLHWPSDIQKCLKKSKKQKKKDKKALRMARELGPVDATTEQINPLAMATHEARIQEALPEELGSAVHAEAAMRPDREPESELNPTDRRPTEENQLRMLVSSRHLCLASSTFRKMLDGPWVEGPSNNGPIREVRASDWDAEAFLIVQDIIHGLNTLVPGSVDMELLAKIAAIVDYYDCHAIAEPFVNNWIQNLQSCLPLLYGKGCVLWMSVSWVFLRVDILRTMARLAAIGCHGPIETMGLPVPEALTRIIEEKRGEVTTKVLLKISDLWSRLCERAACTDGCTEILLGSLTRQMYTAGISPANIKHDASSFSVGRLHEVVSAFASPPLRCHDSEWPWQCKSLEDELKPYLEESLELLGSDWLDCVWSRRMKDRDSEQARLSALRASWRTKDTP